MNLFRFLLSSSLYLFTIIMPFLIEKWNLIIFTKNKKKAIKERDG